jgi:lysozyme
MAPAQATEQPSRWALTTPAPRVAYLPPLPAAPRSYAITPERRALLNTIRYAEGTWANGHDVGYRIMFGGSVMPHLKRHPNKVNYSRRYASAAAGAYQFMPFTWAMATRALGLPGHFHPQAQDQAAIYLIQRRGALHLADRGQLTPELTAKLAPEWASFPTLAGHSYYGQPVKRYQELRAFYDWNLAQLRRAEQQRQNWQPVAIRQVPPPCDDDSLACKLKSVGSEED